MKKIILFLSILSLFLFVISCSEDNVIEPEPNVNPDIQYVGEWIGTSDKQIPMNFYISEREKDVIVSSLALATESEFSDGRGVTIDYVYYYDRDSIEAKVKDGRFSTGSVNAVFEDSITCWGTYKIIIQDNITGEDIITEGSFNAAKQNN